MVEDNNNDAPALLAEDDDDNDAKIQQQELVKMNLPPMRLFETLDMAQSEHGVPHQDYAQYHRYCTQRLFRLRRCRSVRNSLVHSSKYAKVAAADIAVTGAVSSPERVRKSKPTKTSGRGRHAYYPQQNEKTPHLATATTTTTTTTNDDDDENKNEQDNPDPNQANVLWNLLFQAERAWAQACDMQQQFQNDANNNNNNNKKQSTKKAKNPHAHVQRRLNKAVRWASCLEEAVTNGTNPLLCCGGGGGSNDNVSNPAAATTAQECVAYAAWMKGNAALERKNHASAYRHYRASLKILSDLAAAAAAAKNNNNNDDDDDDNNNDGTKDAGGRKDVWTARSDTVLRPLVRFCQYEARDELTTEELQESLSPSAVQSSSSDHSSNSNRMVVHFRNQDLALDNYKPLAVLYLKMEDLLSRHLKRTAPLDESQSLQLLTYLDDACKWVHQELVRYSGNNGSETKRELRGLEGYFSYHKLAVWRQQQEQRVQVLMNDSDNNNNNNSNDDEAAIVHVYEQLQQNAQQMADLPGKYYNESENSSDGGEEEEEKVMDLEEDPYWLEAQAHLVRIRALRCYHLARLYEGPLLGGTTAQVGALLAQSQKLAERALEEMAACGDVDDEEEDNGGKNDAYLEALEDLLDNKIPAVKCRIEATRYLQHQQAAGGASCSGKGASSSDRNAASGNTDRPLWLRLDDFDAGNAGGRADQSATSALVDNPLLPIPMPCKPAFYDLAWPVVGGNLPTDKLDTYLAKHDPEYEAGDSAPTKSGGLLSWFVGR